MWLSICGVPAKRSVYVGKLEIKAVANKCDRRIGANSFLSSNGHYLLDSLLAWLSSGKKNIEVNK